MLAELAARRASGESGQPAKGAAQSAAGAGADDLKEPSEEEEEEEDAGMFSEAELEQLRQVPPPPFVLSGHAASLTPY